MKILVKKLLIAGALLATTRTQSTYCAAAAGSAGGADTAAEARIINEENATDDQRNFIRAVKDHDLDTVQLLCAENPGLITRRYHIAMCEESTDTDPTYFTTPFHVAAYFGHTNIVTTFFKFLNLTPENPDALVQFTAIKDYYDSTPLHLAAWQGQTATVTQLFTLLQPLGLEKASFAQLKNNDGDTPLHLAAWNGKIDVIRYFIQTAHITLSLPNNEHETPLTLAIRHRRDLSPAEATSPLATDLKIVIYYLADISPEHISPISHEPYGNSKPITIFPCGHHIETEYVASIVPQRCLLCRGPITPSLEITSPAEPFVTAQAALDQQALERQRSDDNGGAAGGSSRSGGGSGSDDGTGHA